MAGVLPSSFVLVRHSPVVSLTDVFRQSTATAAPALLYMANSSADERCVHAVGVGMALLHTSSQHPIPSWLGLACRDVDEGPGGNACQQISPRGCC